MKDVLESFQWHSALGIDAHFDCCRRILAGMPKTAETMRMFAALPRSDYLVHRTTKALWKISNDGKSIEPIFDADVLSEDDVRKAMQET